MNKFFSTLAKRTASAKNFLLVHESRPWLFTACGLFALRLCLARLTSCYIITQAQLDDLLMINYSDLFAHFVTGNVAMQDALVKDMGFPIILRVIKFFGVSYTDMISLLWFFAALSTVALMRVLTGRKIFLRDVVIFAFVIFSPIAFDAVTGTRLYRNAALTPLYFVVLNMLAIFFAQPFLKSRTSLTFSIIFGLTFTLTYYIKEDGIWLLCCLVSVTAIALGKIFFSGEEIFKRVAILLIPLMIFAGGTVAYKAVNKIFFGVYLINNRTDGELANFLKNVYKIQSDARTAKTWAPTDAIVKAFDASATLQAMPALREAVMHTHWFSGDIETNQIFGDFLGWVMFSALYDSGTCKNPVDQENFLRKVNAELTTAFETGRLQKDDRFQLIASGGGLSAQEIFSLVPLMLTEYRAHVLLYLYEPGSMAQNFKQIERLQRISKRVNMNLTEPNPHADLAKNLLEKIFALYSVIQALLFVAAMIGVGGSVRKIFRRKKNFPLNERLMLSIAAGAMILSAVYAFAIAWFCAFLYLNDQEYTLQFYSVGLVPMLMTFEIFGTYLFYRLCKN